MHYITGQSDIQLAVGTSSRNYPRPTMQKREQTNKPNRFKTSVVSLSPHVGNATGIRKYLFAGGPLALSPFKI